MSAPSRMTELLNLDPLTCDDGVLARAYQDLLVIFKDEHEARQEAEGYLGQIAVAAKIGLNEPPSDVALICERLRGDDASHRLEQARERACPICKVPAGDNCHIVGMPDSNLRVHGARMPTGVSSEILPTVAVQEVVAEHRAMIASQIDVLDMEHR